MHTIHNGTVTTLVYRMATHTNQCLFFSSHRTVTHKVAAVVRTLTTMASALSSSGVERVEEEKQVVNALKENGYPSSFIYKHSCPSRPRQGVDDQRPRTTLTLPYSSGLSEAVRRILKPLDIRVVFRPLSTLCRLLVHPRDPVPMEERKGVVYSVQCDECPKMYIRQTGQSLKHQLAEHQRGDVAASALAEHALDTGHHVDLSKSEGTDHPYTTTRCLLESWHMQGNQNNLA